MLKSLSPVITAALLLVNTPALAEINVTVTITGVEGRLLDNVRNSLSVEQQKNDPNLTAGRLHKLHNKADQEIKQALEPFGYYHPAVTKDLTHRNDTWAAAYHIDAGPPVRIKSVDLKILGPGKDDPQFQQLAGKFPLHTGDILDQQSYESAKDGFENLAAERGYFDFAFTAHAIRIDLAANTATVTLHMKTGPHYRFGGVTFQQDFLNDSLLQRYIPFKKGNPYSTNELLDLHSALSDTTYFSRIEIQAQRNRISDLEVPILVKLEPQKRNRYSIGVGYGTDTGARLKLGWDIRRVNRRGHHVSTTLQLSQVQNTFSSSYIIPIRNPRTDSFSFNSSLQTEDIADVQDRLFTLGGSQTVQRHSGWLESVYLNLQRELYSVGNESGEATLVVPGTTWTRIHANNRIYTRHGSRVTVDVRGSHPAIGATTAFIQTRIQAKLIRGVTDLSRVILRGDLGFTHVGNFSTLPPSFRFFAGGDQSVRGYAYRSLGPKNAQGFLVGGNQLVVGSIEYEHVIFGKWSAALFYDIGNALDDFSTPLKRGTGFGVRWRSPIGMLRLDLAWALSEPGTPLRLHFYVGPDL